MTHPGPGGSTPVLLPPHLGPSCSGTDTDESVAATSQGRGAARGACCHTSAHATKPLLPTCSPLGSPTGVTFVGQGVDGHRQVHRTQGPGSLPAQSRTPPNPQPPPFSLGSSLLPPACFWLSYGETARKWGMRSTPRGLWDQGLVQGGVILRKACIFFFLSKL